MHFIALHYAHFPEESMYSMRVVSILYALARLETIGYTQRHCGTACHGDGYRSLPPFATRPCTTRTKGT